MRIRKRLPLSSIADRRSEAAPPSEPSDQSMANKTWAFPEHEESKEVFGDETLTSMETDNDIRKIVTSLHPPLSAEQEYKVVPLKKRKGSFEIGDGAEETKRESGGAKKRERGGEGSRCSRVNGRGWRCCQPTMVGYSLCQHHLGKGRSRVIRGGGGGAPPREEEEEEEEPLMVKRTKVGVVKARSMSSLLSQI